MRISDWSSDVCSSDLLGGRSGVARSGAQYVQRGLAFVQDVLEDLAQKLHGHVLERQGWPFRQAQQGHPFVQRLERHDLLAAKQTGRAACRERVCTYV